MSQEKKIVCQDFGEGDTRTYSKSTVELLSLLFQLDIAERNEFIYQIKHLLSDG